MRILHEVGELVQEWLDEGSRKGQYVADLHLLHATSHAADVARATHVTLEPLIRLHSSSKG